MTRQQRWVWDDADQRMKPCISYIHAIPLEDSNTLLHCAQRSCWCSPRQDPTDPTIILHTAVSTAAQGWILVGENVCSADRTEAGQ